MGSEMCIRDRENATVTPKFTPKSHYSVAEAIASSIIDLTHHVSCLLYTSDAADERSSVDLGGRRIIKKKKREEKG